MSEYIFILGAGCSKDAGAPLMFDFMDAAYDLKKKLKASDELAKDFGLVFKALSSLEASLAKAKIDLRNVESVFAAFEMAKLLQRLGSLKDEEVNRLPTAITRVIEKTLETSIKFPVLHLEGKKSRVLPPFPYNQFTHLLADIIMRTDKGPVRPVSIMTFNYDVCLDYAFHFNCIPANYALDTARNEGIPFFKLHGSINWTVCQGCNQIVPWNMDQFFVNYNWNLFKETPSVNLDIASRMKTFKHCGDTHAEAPMLVPPTWNKGEHYAQLTEVWSKAAAELANAENIVIIGYSLPETDQFFRYLYALGTTGGLGQLKRFLVFDPNRLVRDRFESLLGPLAIERFSFYEATFNGSISTLRNILDIPEKKESYDFSF